MTVSDPIADQTGSAGKAIASASVLIGGPGTVVLSGANTYTGSTTLAGGNLKLSGSAFLNTLQITVATSGAGNNTLDASGNTLSNPFGGRFTNRTLIYTAGSGRDSFAGGVENDGVYVSAAAAAGDTIKGGTGTNTLYLTTAGAVDLSHVSGFGQILPAATIGMATGGNTFTLSDTTFTGVRQVTIRASGSGSNGVNASGDTAASAGKTLIYGAGSGADSFVGGFENDGVYVSATQVSGDTLTGGSGSNALYLTTPYGADLSHVSGFGQIYTASALNFATAGSWLQLGDATFTGVPQVTVNTGRGTNIVDASRDTAASTAKTLIVGAGPGTLTFTGGAENDGVYVSAAVVGADTITAGSGTNSLYLMASGSADLSHVAGFGYIWLDGSGIAAKLSDANFTGIGGTLVAADLGTGNSIDGSAVTAGKIAFTGSAGGDTLKGGAGNDAFYLGAGSDTLTGGGGSNSFVYGPSSGLDQLITDFKPVTGGDMLNFADVTTSFIPGTSDPNQYVHLSDFAFGTEVFVDPSGSGSFAATPYALLQGDHSLSVSTLYNQGNLIL